MLWHLQKRAIEGSWRVLVSAIVVIGAIGGAIANARPIALPPRVIATQPTLVTPVIDRPEIRSYQPYSGLQFNFSPEPLPQRGVHRKRPKIVAPRPVDPVIEYGPSGSYSTGGYAYCTDRPGQIEPRDGPYGDAPLGQRTCP
jgi:hypothetical protein